MKQKHQQKIMNRVKKVSHKSKLYTAKELMGSNGMPLVKKLNNLIGPRATHHKNEPTGK